MTGPARTAVDPGPPGRVMSLQFGTNALGHVDTVAAAAALGVSPRTVRRWLAGSSGRQLAHIPPRRLRQLIEALQPNRRTAPRRTAGGRLRPEGDHATEAAAKAGRLAVLGEAAVDRAARRRHPRRPPGRNPATRSDAQRPQDNRDAAPPRIRSRFVIVPTRFHATVLVHEMLTELGPWRFQAKPGSVLQGITLPGSTTPRASISPRPTPTWACDDPDCHTARRIRTFCGS